MKLRKVIALLIVICVFYFLIGGVAVLFKFLDVTKYAIIGGVVGGLASVLGLITLARPALNQEDLQQVELTSLKTLAETSEKIKALEQARTAAKQEIHSLSEQKEKMEFLVRKASLSLFLQEQRNLYQKKITEIITTNKDLQSHLAELNGIDNKLLTLNEEIQTDPNVKILQEIIASAKRQSEDITIDFEGYFPFTRSILLLTRDILRSVGKVIKSV